MEIIFILCRIILGGFFVWNGVGHLTSMQTMTNYAEIKKIPMPATFILLSGLLLIFCGLGIITGVFTAISISLLALFLIVTAFVMHRFWSVPIEQKQIELVNFTKNIALATALLMLIWVPTPWVFSIGF